MTSTNRTNHVCKYLADTPAVLVYPLLENGAEQETVGTPAVLVYPLLQSGAEQETVGIAVGDTSLQANGAERGGG